jgi:hypothetical protein
MSKDSLAHQLSSFEGVYCSGLFVPDPAITRERSN